MELNTNYAVIKTESDYELSIAELNRCLDSGIESEAMTTHLNILSLLIEQYEDSHLEISLPAPIPAIIARMEELNLTRKDVIPYFGSASKASEVLNFRRSLSLSMMRTISAEMRIPMEVLSQEYELHTPVSHSEQQPTLLNGNLAVH